MPRPAPADHPAHPGVQADAHRRRVLARQREEPAAAADLRHRLAVPRGAGRVPGHAGRGGEAGPPQARRRAGPVLVPDRDRQRAAGVPPQGRRSSAGCWRTTRARRHEEAGYEFVNTPHLTKSELFETSGHLEWYAEGMYPPMELDGAKYYLKPMNCPMHILIYAVARAVLPRAAAAAVRVRHRVPVREVRRGARPDPGPRLHPGRLAHLLHPGAAGPASWPRCWTSWSACCATSG